MTKYALFAIRMVGIDTLTYDNDGSLAIVNHFRGKIANNRKPGAALVYPNEPFLRNVPAFKRVMVSEEYISSAWK
jgi:hypothetical protein